MSKRKKILQLSIAIKYTFFLNNLGNITQLLTSIFLDYVLLKQIEYTLVFTQITQEFLYYAIRIVANNNDYLDLNNSEK